MAPEGLLRSSPRSAAPRDCLSVPRAQRTHGTSGDCRWAVWLRLTTAAARVSQPQVLGTSTAPRKLCWQVSAPRASLLQSCMPSARFERRRDCCLLLCECPTDLWLRCCAQVHSVAPPRRAAVTGVRCASSQFVSTRLCCVARSVHMLGTRQVACWPRRLATDYAHSLSY